MAKTNLIVAKNPIGVVIKVENRYIKVEIGGRKYLITWQ
jgi:hypothetical protein